MKLKCNRCQVEVNPALTLNPRTVIPTLFKSPNFDANPKWTFMIRATCPLCDTYIKFVKQDKETVEKLFAALPPVTIE